MQVTLSYEEKILNALAHVKHKKTDDCITRDQKEFAAIREVLKPQYDYVEQLKQEIKNLNTKIGLLESDIETLILERDYPNA